MPCARATSFVNAVRRNALRLGRTQEGAPLGDGRGSLFWPDQELFGRAKPYRSPATVVKTLVRLLPAAPRATTAATAIRAAIKPYSIAVAPSWFLKSVVSGFNMKQSSWGLLIR